MRLVLVGLLVAATAAIGAAGMHAWDSRDADAHTKYWAHQVASFVCTHEDARYCDADIRVDHLYDNLWRVRLMSNQASDKCFVMDRERMGGVRAPAPPRKITGAFSGVFGVSCA